MIHLCEIGLSSPSCEQTSLMQQPLSCNCRTINVHNILWCLFSLKSCAVCAIIFFDVCDHSHTVLDTMMALIIAMLWDSTETQRHKWACMWHRMVGGAVSRYADMVQYGRNQMSIKNKVNWAYVYKFSCIITLNGCVDVDGKAQQNVASLFCPRWKWSKSQEPVHEQAKSVKKKCIRFRNIFRSEIHWCETSSPFFFLRVCHLFFVPWTFPLPFASIWCDTSSIAIWFCHFGVFFFFFFMHMFSTSNLIIYKKPGNERAPNTTNRKCFCVEIARTPTHPHQSRAEKFLSHYFVFLVHFFFGCEHENE